MLINIVWIIVLQLNFTACFNFPCELHRPSPFSMWSSCAGGCSGMVILLASESVQYPPVLPLNAFLFRPTFVSYIDEGFQRGLEPAANGDTISCLQARYTMDLTLY